MKTAGKWLTPRLGSLDVGRSRRADSRTTAAARCRSRRPRNERVRDSDVQRPHDSLLRAVFSDPAAAVGFLRAYLP